MSGGTLGSGVLQPALANMPVLEATWEGGSPTGIDTKLCKLSGCPLRDDAKYLRQQCQNACEPDGQSDPAEWFDSRAELFDEDLACYTGYD